MQGKMSEKKSSCKDRPKEKIMHKMGRILILNQNYNSSRRVFQNAPNGIRACLDFQNFHGGGFPGPHNRNGPLAHFNTAGLICRTPNAECRTLNANQNHPNKQKKKRKKEMKKTGVLFRLTGVYLALRLV